MGNTIYRYFDPRLVVFSRQDTREGVLQELIDAGVNAKKILDGPAFLKVLLERENIVSTGIGMGVAIPHARLPAYDQFFVAVAVLERGVDWNAIDKLPCKLVFMIGGPDDKQTEYLQLLSGLTLALKDADRRKKLLTANSPSDIMKLFEKS